MRRERSKVRRIRPVRAEDRQNVSDPCGAMLVELRNAADRYPEAREIFCHSADFITSGGMPRSWAIIKADQGRSGLLGVVQWRPIIRGPVRRRCAAECA